MTEEVKVEAVAEEGRKRRRTKEEVLEGGRLLGVIARVDPELYEFLEETAERTGESPINIMVNMVKKYLVIQKVEKSSMNIDQLMVAFDLFKDLVKEAMSMYMSLATAFFNEMTVTLGQIVESKVQERLKELEVLERPEDAVRKRLITTFLNILEPMLYELMRNVIKATGGKVPESLKLKVPVEVKVSESKT
jgi:signal transduction histidine kinase